MCQRDLFGPLAGLSRIGPKVVFIWADHRQYTVLHLVSGICHIVGPLVLLDWPVGRGPAFPFVVLFTLKTDPRTHNFLNPVAPTQQSKTATLRDETSGLPGNENIVTIVVNFNSHVPFSLRLMMVKRLQVKAVGGMVRLA
jgi:hypothetical protein